MLVQEVARIPCTQLTAAENSAAH